MENTIFCDFVTFFIDFDFCFKIRFLAYWITEKNMIFMTSNGPSD